MLRDNETAHRLGANALKLAEETLSWEDIAAKTEQVYREIVVSGLRLVFPEPATHVAL